ncbi:hypothetical protein [Hyalangium versicolor]|uniref:hypothetical protein n=1 Tax=Hyalangium versicolor TaxID=2861190 RepID=UPI001CCB1CA1|nr:hypothetical protein [Hyalangium versicolor]
MSATLVAVLMILGAWPLPAHAQDEFQRHLNAAIRLYQGLEYERALTQIELARKMPHGSDDEVKLSLYEGILQAELGHPDEMTAAFKSALLVQPDVKLPVRVAPKVSTAFESVRQQAKRELAAMTPSPPQPTKPEVAAKPPPAVTPAPTTVSTESSSPKLQRRHALIPAIAGGALVVAGGISYALSRSELSKLRDNDPGIQSRDAVDDSVSKGNRYQTIGVTLLGVGTAGLAAAAGIYFLGAPDKPATVGLTTDGKSAFVYGRWP